MICADARPPAIMKIPACAVKMFGEAPIASACRWCWSRFAWGRRRDLGPSERGVSEVQRMMKGKFKQCHVTAREEDQSNLRDSLLCLATEISASRLKEKRHAGNDRVDARETDAPSSKGKPSSLAKMTMMTMTEDEERLKVVA